MPHRLSVDHGENWNGVLPVSVVSGFQRQVKKEDGSKTDVPVIIGRTQLETEKDVEWFLQKIGGDIIGVITNSSFEVFLPDAQLEQGILLFRMAGYRILERAAPTIEFKPEAAPKEVLDPLPMDEARRVA